MKKFIPYINSLNIDSTQKCIIYNNVLARKISINSIFKVLKNKLYERINNKSKKDYGIIEEANIKAEEFNEEQEK